MRRALILRVTLCWLLVATGVAGAGARTAGAAATHDDTVWAFGAASFRGSTSGMRLSAPVAGMASTTNGAGYWIVTANGSVYSFNAPYYGGVAGWPKPIVGITATPTGHGYWIVASDGAVFPRGDAHQYGGMNGTRLAAPITGLVAGPADGTGYWLIARDGGVFTKGTARFYGSTGAMRLRAPIVGMAATPDGKGYWLVATDGGVFTFGNAPYRGSTGAMRLPTWIMGIARTGNGQGYWLVGADGGVFTFGNAQFKGSAAGQVPSGRYVAQIAGMPNGDGYRLLALKIPPPPRPPDVALMGPGASGAAVVYLQNRLLLIGYWLPGADGSYGSLTQQAVWAFQKVEGLPRTGVVDAATQARFRTAQRPRPRSHSGSLVEVNKTKQVMMIVRNGIAAYTFNISSGSDIPYNENGNSGTAHTPEGVFTFIRAVDGPDHGPLGTLYRPRYFTWQGHAVHGYSSVPPYPASHGCVRVSNQAIDWIWATNQMPLGSTIWVYV